MFIALVGGIVQFGMVFWAQNTLTQVARDTGRWAATQTSCDAGNVGSQANTIAQDAALFGYKDGNFTIPAAGMTTAADVTGYTGANSMAVVWTHDSSESPPQNTCPPKSKDAVWHVTIRMNQTVPTFFPGMQYLPGLGTCDPSCHISLSSSVQYRMEPTP